MAQVRSVAEVEQSVRWIKYHPVGERGMFLGNYEAEFGSKPAPQHVEDCYRDRRVVIQIETAEAVECVEGIAAVDGEADLGAGGCDPHVHRCEQGSACDGRPRCKRHRRQQHRRLHLAELNSTKCF